VVFQDRLSELVHQFQHPQRRIGYGNLRYESSDWGQGDERATNFAIIYETPGGSTAQINVTYEHAADQFAYLDETGSDRTTTRDVDSVIRYVQAQVDHIPAKRREVLFRQVDNWVDEGMAYGALFAELNQLIQLEFVGGRITHEELKEAIKRAYERRTGKKFTPEPGTSPTAP
jgi:hypothetical protein